jgi:mRNA (guanine-N7-)-methyltransferase
MDVSVHYNEHRTRKQVPDDLIGIRNFHNFVKSILISEACKITLPHSRYLDMCCGNGGDISKLVHNNIDEYFGMDIANVAVERALQKKSEQSYVKGDIIHFNAFSSTAGNMLENMKQFDIVSCQFAIHYAFSDERTARTFIQNVAFALRVDGSFIITVPDCEFLRKSKKVLGKRFGNQYYSVNFKSLDDFEDFGSAYDFTFKGSVDNLTEYIVKPEVLIKLCQDCGMELVETKNFLEYKEHENSPLWNRMNAKYNEVSQIYRTYHFKMNEYVSKNFD